MNLSQRLMDIDTDVKQLLKDAEEAAGVLNRIHAVLDGQEWDSGTPAAVAEILIEAGFEIRAVEVEQCLEPLPKYGDHMTIQEFLESVECGAFIPDDGDGSWATEGSYEMGSSVWSDLNNPPAWATHVVWFNK